VDVRKVTGTNLKNQRTGQVIYTPPVGEVNLRNKLSNWEPYIHEHDVDPLIALAVAHYQFEAIHPFLDGNGRTGRILNILFLIENVNAIVELQKQTSLYIKDRASKVYSHELVELLFEKPYLRVKDLLEREIYSS